MNKQYCVYCGRVAHRCTCDAENSRLHRFFARNPTAQDYYPRWMSKPYKRGVPPQIKRQERYTVRKNFDAWYRILADTHGEQCLNCGVSSDNSKLVIDHVVSVAKGGLSTLDNLQLLCADCNQIKWKLCIDCRSDTK